MKLPTTITRACVLCVVLFGLRTSVVHAQTSTKKPAPAAVPTVASQGTIHAALKPPPGLPADWDSKIPIAASSKLESSREEKGTRHVLFSATGGFDELIAFYYNGLIDRGFTRSGAAKLPLRHMYKLVFNSDTVSNQSLTIMPGKTANSYSVEFTYPIAGSAATMDHKGPAPGAKPTTSQPSNQKK